jgi:hypothetical protein
MGNDSSFHSNIHKFGTGPQEENEGFEQVILGTTLSVPQSAVCSNLRKFHWTSANSLGEEGVVNCFGGPAFTADMDCVVGELGQGHRDNLSD